MIGRISTQDYIEYVKGNKIFHCPITKEDIVRVENIAGPNLDSLKGYRNVTLAIDIMAINKIPTTADCSNIV